MNKNFIDTSLQNTHPSWHTVLREAFLAMDQTYLQELSQTQWLPGPSQFLNAFRLPLNQTQFVLYGESPYPRSQSANGYAFWDAAVTELWSNKGLSKSVNRATSLRNFLKMLLVAEGALTACNNNSQTISELAKHQYCQRLEQLFERMLQKGFLLLNASLVLSSRPKVTEARYWQDFHHRVLTALRSQAPQLLLFGKIADQLQTFAPLEHFSSLRAEHPYNLSFINNANVLAFFKPLRLLSMEPSM